MSRTTTPAPVPQAKVAHPPVPHDKVAQRAYEKWVKNGMKHGRDQQDWLEAEAEVRAEIARGGNSGMRK